MNPRFLVWNLAISAIAISMCVPKQDSWPVFVVKSIGCFVFGACVFWK